MQPYNLSAAINHIEEAACRKILNFAPEQRDLAKIIFILNVCIIAILFVAFGRTGMINRQAHYGTKGIINEQF
jgi:hypothetical protein